MNCVSNTFSQYFHCMCAVQSIFKNVTRHRYIRCMCAQMERLSPWHVLYALDMWQSILTYSRKKQILLGWEHLLMPRYSAVPKYSSTLATCQEYVNRRDTVIASLAEGATWALRMKALFMSNRVACPADFDTLLPSIFCQGMVVVMMTSQKHS